MTFWFSKSTYLCHFKIFPHRFCGKDFRNPHKICVSSEKKDNINSFVKERRMNGKPKTAMENIKQWLIDSDSMSTCLRLFYA